MADEVGLLFRIRAENAQAKVALKEVQATVAGLRSSFGSDLAVMEKVGTQALQSVSREATTLVRNVPLIGGSFAQALGGISTFTTAIQASASATSVITSLQTEAAAATTVLTSAQEAAAVSQAAVNVAKEAYLPLTALATAGTTTEAAAKAVLTAAEEAAAVATTELAAAEEAAALTATELAVATTAVDASLAPVIIAVGALAIAIGGAALLVGGLAVAAFKLAESASEAGSKIHDLSQQTNLSALTLSGLSVAADDSTGSLDTLAPAIGRLNRIALSAVEGNKAAIATLKQFGLTGQEVQANTDAALGKIITRLHELVPSGQAAGAATKLFGRAGAELIPIVEQMNGNLDGAIQKAKDLGKAFDDEAARAADEFGDHLSDLKHTVEGLAYSVGNVLVPSFNELFRVWAAESQGGILGHALNEIKLKLFEIKSEAYVALAAFETLFSIGAGTQLGTIIDTFNANLARIVTEANTEPADTGKKGPPLDTTGKGDSAARKKAAEEYRVALKAAADAEKDLQIANQTNTRNNKEELDKQTIDLDQFTENAKRYNDDLKKAALDRLKDETDATNVAFNKKILSQAQYNEKQHELLTQRKEEEEKFNAQDQALENARLKGNAQAAQANRDRIYASQVAADNRLLAEDKRLADEGYILFAEAEARKEEIEKTAYERTKARLNEELIDQETSAERRKAIIQELADLDNDYQNQVRDNIDKTAKARQKDIDEQQKEADELYRIQHDLLERIAAERLKHAQESGVGNFLSGLDTGVFDVLRDKTTGASQGITTMAQAMKVLDQVGGAAVRSMAQGIGGLVQNMVLMGTAGPHAMQKLVASVLAGVAAQAAVQAVMELAYAFAAMSPWGAIIHGSPLSHFKAAALFGSIALIAGVAGRGIAGDAFKSDAAGSGGGGGTSTGTSGSTTTTPKTPDTIREGRFGGSQTASEAERTVTINLGLREGIVADHFQKDFKLNGVTRLVIRTDGGDG